MFDPLSVLAAIIPTLKYAFTRIVDYKTGGPKPSNAQEAVALGDLEIRRLEAISKLDDSEGASPWVVNIRAMQRPLVVFLVLLTWVYVVLNNQVAVNTVCELASLVFFYLFGERTSMAIMKRVGKT